MRKAVAVVGNHSMSSQNYFALFGLEPSFRVDVTSLEKHYFQKQRLVHPDRFIGASDAAREQAQADSTLLNDAYTTLKSPLQRARYLLHLQGVSISEADAGHVKASPDILMETMEWRELIHDAQSADALHKLEQSLQEKNQKTLDILDVAFEQSDITQATQHTIRLRYLTKAQEELQQQLKRITHGTFANS